MWHNRENRKKIKGRIFCTYIVGGLNLDYFLNVLRKNGVNFYNAKKIDEKRIKITIKRSDRQKFFAITQDMCYTDIKEIKIGGLTYPFLFFVKNFGLAIGVFTFIFCSYFFNDFIFSIDFTGNGKIYGKEMLRYLEDNGVCQYSRFSNIDVGVLEDKILAENDRFSFVSVNKRGNRLNVELILKEGGEISPSKKTERLFSNVNGVIEDIKVYRGTAVVKVGDKIAEGDVLVEGFATVKETTVKVNVIATVSVIVEYRTEYVSLNKDEENIALIFAEESIDGKEIVSYKVDTELKDGEYRYQAIVYYRHIISVF